MSVSAVQQAESTASAMLERARKLQEEAHGAAEAAKAAAEHQAQREAASIRSTAEAEAAAIIAAARAAAERDASTWTGDIERKHAQKAAFNQARGDAHGREFIPAQRRPKFPTRAAPLFVAMTQRRRPCVSPLQEAEDELKLQRAQLERHRRDTENELEVRHTSTGATPAYNFATE